MSGFVDASRRLGPKWTKTVVTPLVSGDYTFVLHWEGDANLRMSVKEKITGAWVTASNTDDVADDRFNMWLSDLRAKAVKTWFTQHGIPAEMIDAQGLDVLPEVDGGVSPSPDAANMPAYGVPFCPPEVPDPEEPDDNA